MAYLAEADRCIFPSCCSEAQLPPHRLHCRSHVYAGCQEDEYGRARARVLMQLYQALATVLTPAQHLCSRTHDRHAKLWRVMRLTAGAEKFIAG